MAEKGILGLLHRRIVQTTTHSLHGLSAAVKTQEAFRCEVGACAVLIPSAFWLAESKLQLILLIGALLFVLTTELLNTGIEIIVDRIGLDFHELSGRAKDVGSAAVLISLVYFFMVWGLILSENISQY
tara:strand:- start:9193 stop:9576 length:384 start_codon:yes stop_codon:yes gene_type:complete